MNEPANNSSGKEHSDEPSNGGAQEAPRTEQGTEERLRLIRRKALRMTRARKQHPSLWRHISQVGVLGWLMVLPLVGLSALGRVLALRYNYPNFALWGVFAGLALGAYLVWRNVRRNLQDDDDAV